MRLSLIAALFLFSSTAFAEYDFKQLKQPIVRYLSDGYLVTVIEHTECSMSNSSSNQVIEDVILDIKKSLHPDDISMLDNLLNSEYWNDIQLQINNKVDSYLTSEVQKTNDQDEVCNDLRSIAATTMAKSIVDWSSLKAAYGYQPN